MLDRIINDSNVEPRDYQRRIVEQCDTQFNDVGVRSVMLESPTGSGKTCMGLLTAKLLQEQHNLGVGWVAMRRVLLHQAAHENQKLGINVDSPEFISMFDNTPPKADKQGRKIDLLIVDEAQHDAANSMAHIHNQLKPRWVLGLTATPYRTDRMKLCFDKVIRDIGIHQLIQYGFLSKYHLYTIESYDVDTVVTTYCREPEKWGKSVMFWHKTHDALRCVEQLKERGIRAEILLGSQSQSHRDEQLRKFDEGKIDVLVNLFLLTEGFDSPSLKTVFVRDSGKGPTIQMAGRVFRKYPGVTHKQVVQSKLTRWPMVRTAVPVEQFVWMQEDSEWRSYKLNRSINKVASRATLMMARKESELPEIIKKNQQRRANLHRVRRRR